MEKVDIKKEINAYFCVMCGKKTESGIEIHGGCEEREKRRKEREEFHNSTIKPFYELQKNAFGFKRYKITVVGNEYNVECFTSTKLYIKNCVSFGSKGKILNFIKKKTLSISEMLKECKGETYGN